MDGIPVHQLLSLASLRFLVCVYTHFCIALASEKALCIFGAVEAGLLGWRIDFIAQRVEGNGYSAADVFGELPCLWGFVDSDCCLIFLSRGSINGGGDKLTATATDITTMAPEITTGWLGILFTKVGEQSSV